jgi:NAD(P)-dependent dehydrogenase (short-subunit alcohol dehydrogenase family)
MPSRNGVRHSLVDIGGKVAIVTGGAWGIGRGTVLRLVREDMRVIATDLEQQREGLDEVVELSRGAVIPCFANAADEADWRRVVRLAERELGGLDVLVNNAGGYEPPNFPDAPSTRWGGVLDVNLKGVMLGIQAVLGPMRRRGGGAIVNVSSVAGLLREPYAAPDYAAAKAGAIALTASLGSLWERDGISVTCICPDWVLTEALKRTVAAMPAEEREEVRGLERAEVRGFVPVEEIADLIVRLACDESLAGRVMVRWADEERERLLPQSRQ